LHNDNKENINPYLDGRREWNERYGSHIKQLKTWKTITFISLFTTLASVAGLTYIGAKNKLVPYVVEVDKVGAVRAVNYAQ
jgi:type IV secretion system protein VirB5